MPRSACAVDPYCDAGSCTCLRACVCACVRACVRASSMSTGAAESLVYHGMGEDTRGDIIGNMHAGVLDMLLGAYRRAGHVYGHAFVYRHVSVTTQS